MNDEHDDDVNPNKNKRPSDDLPLNWGFFVGMIVLTIVVGIAAYFIAN